MRKTLTIRLTEELASWLEDVSRTTGVPAGRLVREQLEKTKKKKGRQRFLRHAGKIVGPVDLSSRKGFSNE